MFEKFPKDPLPEKVFEMTSASVGSSGREARLEVPKFSLTGRLQ